MLGTFKDLIGCTTQERQNKRWQLFLRAAHEIPVNRENSIIAKESADKCRSEILKDVCQWCPPKFVLENLIYEWGADPNIPYDMGGGWGGEEDNGRYVLFVALENCNKSQQSMNDETLALLMTEKALSSVDSNGNSSLHLLCKSLVCRSSDVTDSATGKIIPPKQLSTRSMETIQRFADASPLQRNSDGETPLWCFLHDCNLYNHLVRDFSQNIVQHDIFESSDVERHWRSAHVFLQSLLSCRPSMARATKQHTMSVGGTRHSLEIYPIQMVSGFQSRVAWTSKRQQHSRFQGNAPLYFLNELWRHMERSQNSNKEIDLHPTILLQQALCANMFDVASSLLASYDPKTVRPAGVLPLHTALIHGAPSDLVRELIKLDPTSLHMGANVTLGGQHLIEVPPQRNDLPIHLVLDDCHDRMRKWCSSEESVLEVLEGYAKHCPEYLSHGGDTTTNTRTFGTQKSMSYECNITGISNISTATTAVGVGCPLQLELARVGCGSDGADLLRTGPRWNVVRKILQVRFFFIIFRALGRSMITHIHVNSHVPLLFFLSFPFLSSPFLSFQLCPSSVKILRELYCGPSDNGIDTASGSRYLCEETGCPEVLPLHRCLSLGAPEDVILAILAADPPAVDVPSALSGDTTLHLACVSSTSIYSHRVIATLLESTTESSQFTQSRDKRMYLLPVHSSMKRLQRTYNLLRGGALADAKIFEGDMIVWKSCVTNRVARYGERAYVGRAIAADCNGSTALTIFLPPSRQYPVPPVVDAVFDSLVQLGMSSFMCRRVLSFLEDRIDLHQLHGVPHASVVTASPGFEYVEKFRDEERKERKERIERTEQSNVSGRASKRRQDRVEECRERIRVIDILTAAHPTAMYDRDEEGRRHIEVLRRIIVDIRTISKLPGGNGGGGGGGGGGDGSGGSQVRAENKKKEERNQVELFVPLGRRRLSHDVETTHLSVEAHYLCGLEQESMQMSNDDNTLTSEKFMLKYLSRCVQTSLYNELVSSYTSTELLRNVYINNRSGHRGMYGASLNGIKVQPQYPSFMRRAEQLRQSIAARSRRRDSSPNEKLLKQKNGHNVHQLYVTAHRVRNKYDRLLEKLSLRTNATYMRAKMKKPLRVLEKAMVAETTRCSPQDSSSSSFSSPSDDVTPTKPWNTGCVLDVVRGALSFTTMNEMLMCLELLAATTTDEKGLKESKRCGWDAVAAGIEEKLDIVRIKNRFHEPTSGGWADAMVNFRFAGEDHVCEIQFVHAQMMLVRKQMGAHFEYEQFRSALELLEATGNERIVIEIDEEANRAEEEEQQQPKEIRGVEERVTRLEEQVQKLMEENRKLWDMVANKN